MVDITIVNGDYNGDIIWLMIGDYTTQYVGSYNLVGGLEHEFYFPFHIWDVILPIDTYFSEGLKPPTIIGRRIFFKWWCLGDLELINADD